MLRGVQALPRQWIIRESTTAHNDDREITVDDKLSVPKVRVSVGLEFKSAKWFNNKMQWTGPMRHECLGIPKQSEIRSH